MSKKVLVLVLSILALLWTLNFPSISAEREGVVLPNIPRITPDELRGMIDKGADLVVVDTRDSGSYDSGHIKGAINIYFDPTADPTDRQLMLIALPMDKLLVTYCDCTDDANSAKLADELYRLGYDRDKVKVLAGGSLKWVELKYPMVGNQ
jgi:rhodanese-related sulfurtransferase